jgi:hypothetical protein
VLEQPDREGFCDGDRHMGKELAACDPLDRQSLADAVYARARTGTM